MAHARVPVLVKGMPGQVFEEAWAQTSVHPVSAEILTETPPQKFLASFRTVLQAALLEALQTLVTWALEAVVSWIAPVQAACWDNSDKYHNNHPNCRNNHNNHNKANRIQAIQDFNYHLAETPEEFRASAPVETLVGTVAQDWGLVLLEASVAEVQA